MATVMLMMTILGVLSTANAQVGYEFPAPGNTYGVPDQRAEESLINVQEDQDPLAVLSALIPRGGIPGENYPILASVPDTGFACADQEFPGYYADVSDEAKCQVFHVCHFDGRLDSFLCPNGTIFNQQYFVCDWWFNVDCSASQEFTRLNAEIGKIPEPVTEASARSEVVAPGQLYDTPAARQEATTTPVLPPTLAPTTPPTPNRFYDTPQ